jgi:hypothetical protein
MGDGDYMYAFQQVVMPIATEFDPDLVIGKSFRLLFCQSVVTCHRKTA